MGPPPFLETAVSHRLSSPSRHGIAGRSQRCGQQPRGDGAQHHPDPPHAYAWQGNGGGGGAWCCSGGVSNAQSRGPCWSTSSLPLPVFPLHSQSPPGNSIPRKISSPILSQGEAGSHAPESPASHPVSQWPQGRARLLPVGQAVGRGGRQGADVAGRELPADGATLISAFAGDRQHHRQGKIWDLGHHQPRAPLDLTTRPVPLPAERRDG